jgi:hypothetical protein
VDNIVEGFVDVTQAELLRMRAGVLEGLALLDTKLAEGLESGEQAGTSAGGPWSLAAENLARELHMPPPMAGETLPAFLHRAAISARGVRMAAGITWSAYLIRADTEGGGFYIETKEQSEDPRHPGAAQSWHWPAGKLIELEDVAQMLSDHEQGR